MVTIFKSMVGVPGDKIGEAGVWTRGATLTDGELLTPDNRE